MTTRPIWVCSVDWERTMEILQLGCGRRLQEWNEQIWQYWQTLGWDQRPSSELDRQPYDVQVYSLNPFEVLLLGVLPYEPTRGTLFVFPSGRWAAVVSETPMERIKDEDVADDA